MVPSVTARETVPEILSAGPAQVLEQLQRLLASRPLRESHQLQAFLEYIVQETLAGRSDGLKESLLGCQVFGRKPEYDPRLDGIVRVQATVLRKRLEKYYAAEGASDPVVIGLPRGGYVPDFRLRAVELVAEPEAKPAVAPVQPVRSPKSAWLAAFLMGCIVTAALAFAWARFNRAASPAPFKVTSATAADCPQLWGAFFAPGANNMIAYGVPLFFSSDGLYIRDVRVNGQGEGDLRRIRKFAELIGDSPQPMDDLYTGVGETEATYRLTNFFASLGTVVSVRNARTVGISDLAGHNVVAVSSLRFQTFLRDLRLPEVFRFQPTTPETIDNLKPLTGEERSYVFRQGAGISTSYALVSLWPGPKPGLRIMHIGGVHTWSTQAAVEFLLQPERLRQIAAEFAKDRQTGARGAVSPYFQILLRVEGRGNQSHRVEYVTHHYIADDRR